MRTLRYALLLAAGLSSAAPALAEDPGQAPPRGDDRERKSKNGQLETKIDDVAVLVTYGRPSARGRTLFGETIPYGKLWRTGADEATVVRFSKDVKIEGKKLPAGVYALFTVPGEKEWTLVFNKKPNQWGAYKHDPSLDALEVKVTPKTAEKTEVLTFEAKDKSIVLRWGTTAVSFSIAKA